MDVNIKVRRLTLLGISTLAVSLMAPQLRAQDDTAGAAAADLPTETVSINFARPSFGLARGQTARFTIVNPTAAADRSGCGDAGTGCADLSVAIVVSMLDQHGGLIARSAAVSIPPGEFRSTDVNRDALPLPGDSGSGRLQMQPVLRMTFLRSASAGAAVPTVLESIEIVDNLTGGTTVVVPAMLLPAVQKVWVAK